MKLSDQSDSLSGKATIDARFLTAGQSEVVEVIIDPETRLLATWNISRAPGKP